MGSVHSASIRIMRFVLAFGILLLGHSPAYSDGGGHECFDPKPPTAAEANILLSTLKSLRESLPPAPEGWKVTTSSDQSSGLPERIYATRGCPAGLSFRVEYQNDGNIMSNYNGMDFDKMDQLSAAMDDAAARGDVKKMQELANQMKAGQSPQDMTAGIEVRCNLANVVEDHENGVPFSVPSAKRGFSVDQDGLKKVILYVGGWRLYDNGTVTPEIDEGAPNTKVQFIEVVIDGEIAEQLARQMDLERMAALTK